jgi:hypothetical protein
MLPGRVQRLGGRSSGATTHDRREASGVTAILIIGLIAVLLIRFWKEILVLLLVGTVVLLVLGTYEVTTLLHLTSA